MWNWIVILIIFTKKTKLRVRSFDSIMAKSSNYKVERWLGQGSFGKVYKAVQISTGQYVALKFIPKANHTAKDLQALRNECDIHSKLDHKNIIKMLEYYDSEKELVLITECAKCSLAGLLKEKKFLEQDEVQKIACDLTSALYYLHSERIIHRDLKPENVLIDYNGSAKICDLGFAKYMTPNTFLLTSFKGTPLYMAPEVLKLMSYDYKADIWSFGCILYELLVGVQPFYALAMCDLRFLIQQPIKWDTRITGDGLSFIQGLLQTNPRKRLGWTEPLSILDHPYVSGGISVDRNVGNFALTKALSPSQEFAKEIQRQDIDIRKHKALCIGRRKRLPKFHGQLDRINPYRQPSNLVMVQNGQMVQLYQGNHKQQLHNQDQLAEVSQPKQASDKPTNGVPLKHNANGYRDLKSSESSLETLTSSSDEETDDDERGTIIMGKSSTGLSRDSEGKSNTQSNENSIDPWIAGTRLATDKTAVDDPVEMEEEWLAYLRKNIKEVKRNPAGFCEKYSFRLIVQPLRNHNTGVFVLEKIAFLLSLPFALDTKKDQNLIRNLENVYWDSKVVPQLIHASKLVVIRRQLGFETSECTQIHDKLKDEDLSALDNCLRLVCFLVHSEERFVIHFCDSIYYFRAYVLFRLFLKLDKRRDRLTSDTLAILCHLMRTRPQYHEILEELLMGDDADGNELWRLIDHKNSGIQSISLRILGYLLLHSQKARSQFISSPANLWGVLRNASAREDPRVVSAAEFAADSLRHLGNSTLVPDKPLRQTSLPLF